MSEFGCSYHLKTNDSRDAVNLLKNSGLKGYVFPSANNWTTFASEGDDFEINDKLITNNKGLLVYYYFADEMGWGFSVFEDDKKISSYGCQWGGPVFDEDGDIIIDDDGNLVEIDDVKIDDGDLNYDELLRIIDNSAQDKLKEILYPQSISEAIGNYPSIAFAQLLEIENVEWVSYGIISRHKNDFKSIISVKK